MAAAAAASAVNKTQIGLKGLAGYLFGKEHVNTYINKYKRATARSILEVIPPTKQCEAVIGKYMPGTECWICGYHISPSDKVCEHVLPVAQASIFWNIFNPSISELKNSRSTLKAYQSYMSRLKEEYGWAHRTICNSVKSDKSFIRQDADSADLYVDEVNIRNFVREIGAKWRAEMKGGGKSVAHSKSKRQHTIRKSQYKAAAATTRKVGRLSTIIESKAAAATTRKVGRLSTIIESKAPSKAASKAASKAVTRKPSHRTAAEVKRIVSRKSVAHTPAPIYDSNWERQRINHIIARYKSIVDYVNNRGSKLFELSRIAMLAELKEGLNRKFVTFIESVPKDVPALSSRVASPATPEIYTHEYVRGYAEKYYTLLQDEIKKLLTTSGITIARHKTDLATILNIPDTPTSIDDAIHKWHAHHKDYYINLYIDYYILMTKMNVFIVDVVTIHLFYIRLYMDIASRIKVAMEVAPLKTSIYKIIQKNNAILNRIMESHGITSIEAKEIMSLLSMSHDQMTEHIQEHNVYAALSALKAVTPMNLENGA